MQLRRTTRIAFTVVPHLSIFGLLLFLAIWEANPRYIANYFPMFVIAAMPAIMNLYASSIRKELSR